MPTSSVRISESIRRAVQYGDYNLSELAREGIEQAIIGELVGICWICGEGIHRKERSEWIDFEYFVDDIADGVIGGRLAGRRRGEHREMIDYEKRNETDVNNDPETYYIWAGNWLSLPDYQPVELCSTCSDYLEKIREQEIHPTDIPIPYQYRNKGDKKSQKRIAEVRPNPRYAYAAESAAVYLADYDSHKQSIFNTKDTNEHIGLFWWAARGRSQRIVGTKYHPWFEIALRSHAQTLRRGTPLQDMYRQGLQAANRTTDKIVRQWQPGRGSPPPGPNDPVNLPDGSSSCIACGTERGQDPLNEQSRTTAREIHHSRDLFYCDACLFSYYNCNQEAGCEHYQPKLDGDSLDQVNIKLYCHNCGSNKDPSKEYKDKLVDKYSPIFNEIATVVPMR